MLCGANYSYLTSFGFTSNFLQNFFLIFELLPGFEKKIERFFLMNLTILRPED